MSSVFVTIQHRTRHYVPCIYQGRNRSVISSEARNLFLSGQERFLPLVEMTIDRCFLGASGNRRGMIFPHSLEMTKFG